VEYTVNFYITQGNVLYYSTKMSIFPRIGENFMFTGGRRGTIVAVQWVFTKEQPTHINLFCEIDGMIPDLSK
jgi:hypothetical protein